MSPDLKSTLARIADRRLGIIQRISDVPLQPGEPRIFVLAARCTRPKYFNGNRSEPVSAINYKIQANGVAFTREEALWRVIGEACERYAGGLYWEPTLVTATREELGEEALPVEQLIGFSDAQYEQPGFPFARFDPRAPLRWTCGWNLTRGVRSFVPAVLVYLGYVARYPHEAFYPTMSTGMAAGRSLEQALLNGLCEVVERDAFMCAWLLRHVQARAPTDALCKALNECERQLLASECADAFVLTATTDIGLPSVLTALRLRNRDALVAGAATSTCIRHAIIRSALEAFHTLN
ncbi:MAG TPA: YcaO-like family protein, partial [Steroidobacteraceae bacterium]